ncbi:MAG: hypothetical protein KDB80_02460 [Planctomycetes bacterium]|nr:hypothetical protein [Planctomycetota bacterium]
MSHDTYKIIHIAGILILFTALGAAFLGKRGEDGKAPRSAMMLHGIAMLVILVAGFGLLARREIHWPWPGWVFAKLGIWIVLGALPVLVKRKVVPAALAWLIAVALGACAAWLAIAEPF